MNYCVVVYGSDTYNVLDSYIAAIAAIENHNEITNTKCCKKS